MRDHAAAAEDELMNLSERIERAEEVWRDVQASPSRRLRKPLRALKNGLDP